MKVIGGVMKSSLLIFFISLIYYDIIKARPISYPGGLTLMLMNNSMKNSLHAHYSPTTKTSLGYKFEYWRGSEFSLNLIQMNNLIKRWNQPESQANFYIKSGIGSAYSDRGQFKKKHSFAGFVGLSADWEDQRYFIQYSNRYTNALEIDEFYTQFIHLGITPYIGNYGDIHTWLMIKIDHTPKFKRNFIITPHFRFFKDVHLIEVGADTRGKIMFNYIFRY